MTIFGHPNYRWAQWVRLTSQRMPDDLFRCMSKFQRHLKPMKSINQSTSINNNNNLLVSASGIVSRQTPFLNSIKYFSSLAKATSFLYHWTNGCGSHCTMHSNRALCPRTTAISFRGCKKKTQIKIYQNKLTSAFVETFYGRTLNENLPLWILVVVLASTHHCWCCWQWRQYLVDRASDCLLHK